MLVVNKLGCDYPQQQLDFSFNVETPSITAVVGESGAGKSTLLSLLCGLLPASRGTATFNGEVFTHLAPHLRPISVLFQEHNLFAHLSAFDNIALGIDPKGRINHSDKKRINEMAERLQLDGLLPRLPSELSGGQKQRVALARCILRQRPLLLLDEPFSALDPALRAEMLQQTRQLATQQGTTVLLVTHHLEEAKSVANNILVIKQGHANKLYVNDELIAFDALMPPPLCL